MPIQWNDNPVSHTSAMDVHLSESEAMGLKHSAELANAEWLRIFSDMKRERLAKK